MKPGELRRFVHNPFDRDGAGKLFLVIDTRQTLCDILMDGKLIRNYDLLYVKQLSRRVDETG
jgi:hypothetical protein